MAARPSDCFESGRVCGLWARNWQSVMTPSLGQFWLSDCDTLRSVGSYSLRWNIADADANAWPRIPQTVLKVGVRVWTHNRRSVATAPLGQFWLSDCVPVQCDSPHPRLGQALHG